MRKISTYVVATLLILACVGVWMASATQTRVEAPALAETIDPTQLTLNAHELPTEEFTDYTFVFSH